MSERAEAKKSRRAPWWMYVVATSFVGMQILVLYLLIWGPPENEGMQAAFVDGGMRIRVVEPNSHFGNGGLSAGDRVLAIDGLPVRSLRDWQAVEANMAAGQPQQWSILRGEQPLQLRVTPERSSLRSRLRHGYIGYLTNAWADVILGLLMIVQRPSDPIAKVGAWFIMTASIAFGTPIGWLSRGGSFHSEFNFCCGSPKSADLLSKASSSRCSPFSRGGCFIRVGRGWPYGCRFWRRFLGALRVSIIRSIPRRAGPQAQLGSIRLSECEG